MFDFLKKRKPPTFEEEMLILITKHNGVSLKDVSLIYNEVKSFDRTIQILDYSFEYNLTIESALNVLS